MSDKDMLLALIDKDIEGGQTKLNSIVRERFVSMALGYRLWYWCEWRHRHDEFDGEVKRLLAAGADPNFTNGYHTVLDTLDNYGHELAEAVRAAGGKTNDAIIAAL